MRNAHLAADGGKGDDAPFTPLPHLWKHGQRRIERRPKMQPEGFFIILPRHDFHGPDRDHPGVVHQYVNPLKARPDGSQKSGHLFWVHDITGESERQHSRSGPILQHFRLRRHRFSASAYRQMENSFHSWQDITATGLAA